MKILSLAIALNLDLEAEPKLSRIAFGYGMTMGFDVAMTNWCEPRYCRELNPVMSNRAARPWITAAIVVAASVASYEAEKWTHGRERKMLRILRYGLYATRAAAGGVALFHRIRGRERERRR